MLAIPAKLKAVLFLKATLLLWLTGEKVFMLSISLMLRVGSSERELVFCGRTRVLRRLFKIIIMSEKSIILIC